MKLIHMRHMSLAKFTTDNDEASRTDEVSAAYPWDFTL